MLSVHYVRSREVHFYMCAKGNKSFVHLNLGQWQSFSDAGMCSAVGSIRCYRWQKCGTFGLVPARYSVGGNNGFSNESLFVCLGGKLLI